MVSNKHASATGSAVRRAAGGGRRPGTAGARRPVTRSRCCAPTSSRCSARACSGPPKLGAASPPRRGSRPSAVPSSHRPATYAIISGLVLAVLAIGAFSYKPTFDLSSAGIPSTAESQTALKTLEEGLPPGATDPTVVLLHQPSGGALPALDVAAFGATLGASVLVFQGLGGQTGLVFLLPVYMYLFVVALGTDYNILMIARLREQAKEGMPARQAASVAFRHAAPTIAAAGLILAGTFASLTLAGGQHDPGPAGIRGRLRDRAGRVRHGHVLLPQPHRPHRPQGLVARPRRRTAGTRRATDPGGRALNRLTRASEAG